MLCVLMIFEKENTYSDRNFAQDSLGKRSLVRFEQLLKTC